GMVDSKRVAGLDLGLDREGLGLWGLGPHGSPRWLSGYSTRRVSGAPPAWLGGGSLREWQRGVQPPGHQGQPHARRWPSVRSGGARVRKKPRRRDRTPKNPIAGGPR